ncbi:hypothetical protein BC835DRAFT_1311772, partial [Cytidiella melzeri]
MRRETGSVGNQTGTHRERKPVWDDQDDRVVSDVRQRSSRQEVDPGVVSGRKVKGFVVVSVANFDIVELGFPACLRKKWRNWMSVIVQDKRCSERSWAKGGKNPPSACVGCTLGGRGEERLCRFIGFRKLKNTPSGYDVSGFHKGDVAPEPFVYSSAFNALPSKHDIAQLRHSVALLLRPCLAVELAMLEARDIVEKYAEAKDCVNC